MWKTPAFMQWRWRLFGPFVSWGFSGLKYPRPTLKTGCKQFSPSSAGQWPPCLWYGWNREEAVWWWLVRRLHLRGVSQWFWVQKRWMGSASLGGAISSWDYNQERQLVTSIIIQTSYSGMPASSNVTGLALMASYHSAQLIYR